MKCFYQVIHYLNLITTCSCFYMFCNRISFAQFSREYTIFATQVFASNTLSIPSVSLRVYILKRRFTAHFKGFSTAEVVLHNVRAFHMSVTPSVVYIRVLD